MGLVRGGGTGDADGQRERAFRAMFDANHQAVLAYAVRRTASAQDAADLLGDVPRGGPDYENGVDADVEGYVNLLCPSPGPR